MSGTQAGGSIVYAAGVPSWLANQPRWCDAAILDSNPGDVSPSLAAGAGLAAATEAICLASVRGALIASELTSYGITHTSDTAKRVMTLREQALGADSALADIPCDVWCGGLNALGSMSILAMGRITAGAVPTWAWQNGGFDGAPVHTGVGDYDVTLTHGIAAADCIILTQPAMAQAAVELTAAGVVHTSDTVKQITTVLEGALGATSAPTDAKDLNVIVLRRGSGKGMPGKFWGGGSVLLSGVAPVWTWHSGCFTDVIADGGTGLPTLNFAAGYGLDADNALIVCTPRVVLAAVELSTIGIARPNDLQIGVSVGQEVGGAGVGSALADVPFDIAVWALQGE